MSQKSTRKKTREHYNVGEHLWRTTDNALFEITNVNLNDCGDDSNYSSYDMICINNAPVEDVTVYLEMVHEPHSIYTIYQPSKPVKGQHVWNMFIDPVCRDKYRHDYYRNKSENEFIVEDVVEKIESLSDLDPCKKCHNGVCEQCHYGYRPKSEVLAEVSKQRKKSETMITLMNLSGHKVQKITLEQFDTSFTMIPPDMSNPDETSENGIKSTKGDTLGCEESEKGIESAPIINSDDEAEKVMNERLDKESVYTGETIEDDSYTRWKNGLKVVNIPKFDLNYFQRGLGYHINKVTSCYPVEFYGIMVEATEDLLKVMKLGTNIHFESTEIIEIPLKEYMNGEWCIVRLIEEV